MTDDPRVQPPKMPWPPQVGDIVSGHYEEPDLVYFREVTLAKTYLGGPNKKGYRQRWWLATDGTRFAEDCIDEVRRGV